MRTFVNITIVVGCIAFISAILISVVELFW